jgi:elongation factor Ts
MAISAQDVMKLRKMTQAGMMDCKKALEEANGDFDKAIEIIREKGKLVAAKRADRETTEGAVRVRMEGNKAIIVCLGCETDFVSATDNFKSLADEIADTAIKNFPADLEALKACNCSNGHTVEEEVSALTGKTGEKLVLAYYDHLEAPYIAQYVHNNNKVGSIVAFNKEVPEEIGKNVAQQVTAMSPVSVSADDCPKDAVEKEMALYRQQIADDPKMAGKPQAMLDNIAKGKLNKYFKEKTLLSQEFIWDNKLSVADYIKSGDKDATVTAFRRFSLSD